MLVEVDVVFDVGNAGFSSNRLHELALLVEKVGPQEVHHPVNQAGPKKETAPKRTGLVTGWIAAEVRTKTVLESGLFCFQRIFRRGIVVADGHLAGIIGHTHFMKKPLLKARHCGEGKPLPPFHFYFYVLLRVFIFCAEIFLLRVFAASFLLMGKALAQDDALSDNLFVYEFSFHSQVFCLFACSDFR
jgi:hypothetical protein